MNTSRQTRRAALAAAILVATASMGARAEYRCATPRQLTNAEVRACNLARQPTPDALIHFVKQTQGIYNLYVNDYVSEADVDRWDAARRTKAAGSPDVANAQGGDKETSDAN